ncbi:MAG TPA: anthranilate phosphoribosyltransferase [Candidatus Lokiarchaeia archaeon]|nr:anthranilate phosphoribosyltransferase [Candidatus Lokiarchaeia archaeon]
MEDEAIKFGIKEALNLKVVDHAALDASQAYVAMHEIMDGTATPAQIGAFLVALKIQEPTIEEISSFARCMKDFASIITPSTTDPVVDTCGTGGDVLKTINISTLSALVTAGAGIVVAKHGNRGVTSSCGSADVLEQAGVNIMASPAVVERSINDCGIGFMFAPVFHPAMKNVVGPRKEVGLRTVFNVLGPLTNPANASGQVLGVYDESIASTMAKVLVELGVQRFFIVHNEYGADEVLPSGKNHVLERNGRAVESRVLVAEDFGIDPASVEDLQVGTSKEDITHAFVRVLKGNGPKALTDAVIMNSALAIVIGGKTTDLQVAASLARESLETGAAIEKLRALVMASGGNIEQYDRFMEM